MPGTRPAHQSAPQRGRRPHRSGALQLRQQSARTSGTQPVRRTERRRQSAVRHHRSAPIAGDRLARRLRVRLPLLPARHAAARPRRVRLPGARAHRVRAVRQPGRTRRAQPRRTDPCQGRAGRRSGREGRPPRRNRPRSPEPRRIRLRSPKEHHPFGWRLSAPRGAANGASGRPARVPSGRGPSRPTRRRPRQGGRQGRAEAGGPARDLPGSTFRNLLVTCESVRSGPYTCAAAVQIEQAFYRTSVRRSTTPHRQNREDTACRSNRCLKSSRAVANVGDQDICRTGSGGCRRTGVRGKRGSRTGARGHARDADTATAGRLEATQRWRRTR